MRRDANVRTRRERDIMKEIEIELFIKGRPNHKNALEVSRKALDEIGVGRKNQGREEMGVNLGRDGK